ncbi:nitroreductase family protein [Methylovorus sp. SPW-M1]
MTTTATPTNWSAFQFINRQRRAIRKFSGLSIPEQDVQELLAEAALAPSSGNLQPYQLHWIRSPALKAEIALACNQQQAAATAADIIVISASAAIARDTASKQLSHVELSSKFSAKSKTYYRKQMKMFNRILGIGASAWWTPLVYAATLLRPCLALLPIGNMGSRHWAARNAIFAAQTILLAAAAKGIDSCPMEGFSAVKIAQKLNLPKGSVIPIVIALGYRAEDARIEMQWRRQFNETLITH